MCARPKRIRKSTKNRCQMCPGCKGENDAVMNQSLYSEVNNATSMVQKSEKEPVDRKGDPETALKEEVEEAKETSEMVSLSHLLNYRTPRLELKRVEVPGAHVLPRSFQAHGKTSAEDYHLVEAGALDLQPNPLALRALPCKTPVGSTHPKTVSDDTTARAPEEGTRSLIKALDSLVAANTSGKNLFEGRVNSSVSGDDLPSDDLNVGSESDFGDPNFRSSRAGVGRISPKLQPSSDRQRSDYWSYRSRNNESCRKSRYKRKLKQIKLAIEERELIEKNNTLKAMWVDYERKKNKLAALIRNIVIFNKATEMK